MGNTSTRESRPPFGPPPRHGRGPSGSGDGRDPYEIAGSSRQHRGSRPDLSFLGISTNERDVPQLELRRETKQEREARKREKERLMRIKERERSMKEEHVDGGYLVTQGVYVGPEDFSKPVVRQLMIERKLAPFWKGLNDFSESWVEHQIVAAVRGMSIPAADEIPPELEYKLTPKPQSEQQILERNINSLTVPISSRSQSFNSDSSRPTSPHGRSSPAPSPSASHIFRSRAKTLASLGASKSSSSPDTSPREHKLPNDPFVNGQPIEAYLYKEAIECPICFLYYPRYLNRTRCCDQPICSECFVQIKRPDPHPPEHEQRDPNAPRTEGEEEMSIDGQLVSEPASCPFCVQPEFGVTYSPPPFRRGLTYAPSNGFHPLAANSSTASSSSSLATGTLKSLPTGTRRRATSLSADDPTVITTDRIRPDWAQKLAAARAHAARRAAAATALHTAAYLVNNNSGNSNDQRSTGSANRRSLLRRGTGTDSPSSRTSSPHVITLAHLAERRAITDHGNESNEPGTNLAPRRASSRRSRIEELEEMMMMEAIRLSLAAEEERRKKEEKEAKKAAKRREKEAKKAEKQASRSNIYSNNASSVALAAEDSGSQGKFESPAAQDDMATNKGKGIDRLPPSLAPSDFAATATSSSAKAPKLDVKLSDDEQLFSSLNPSSSADPTRRVHLRQLSSASSSNSSLVESSSGDQIGPSHQHHEASSSLEPLYSFQSLAGVVDEEDKSCGSHHDGDVKQDCSQQQSEFDTAKIADSGKQTDSTPERRSLDSKEVKTRSTEVLPESSPMSTAS
ncbi:hypothetical protein VTO42DRAFT_8850 [Malbranchea cinnamomea]